MGTFDDAQAKFRVTPNNATAGAYLKALLDADLIGGVSMGAFFDALAEIRAYLVASS